MEELNLHPTLKINHWVNSNNAGDSVGRYERHIFGSSIKRQTFWNKVIQILMEILSYKTPKDPFFLYQGLIPEDIIHSFIIQQPVQSKRRVKSSSHLINSSQDVRTSLLSYSFFDLIFLQTFAIVFTVFISMQQPITKVFSIVLTIPQNQCKPMQIQL